MFRFKQFTICQDRTAMKVGTDGVLLGAWAELRDAQNILDIGTGTGLIALMTAQRCPLAHIEGVEIDLDAAQQARENVLASPWAGRIEIHHTSITNFTPGHLFDRIVCNPPFFTNSTKTPDQQRTIARHSDTLPQQLLLESVHRLLQKDGSFSVILPPDESNSFIKLALQFDLHPSHITYVHPTPAKDPKRYLIRFKHAPQFFTCDHLIIEYFRHQYSEEYVCLTKSFYLNM